MKIEINEQKILTEILERDGDLHLKIKAKVEQRLVDDLVERIESKYITQRWNGEKEIADSVISDLEEKQTDIVKQILKKFYDSYRYKKADIAILKELKKLLEEKE
jgi:hypothetical protein